MVMIMTASDTAASPLDLMAALVLEDGRMWGEVAASNDFQWEDAEAIFTDDGPPWHFLTRPRSGSKTTDLSGVALCWLATTAAPGARGYVFSGSRDQAALLLDAASGLVDRTPELSAVIEVQATKLVALRTGATVEIRSADGGTAFGLRPSFCIVDELAQFPDARSARRLWTAIVSSLGKVPGCRFVCLTTAGEPSHWSYKVLQDALAAPERWHVHQVAGILPWVQEADLRAQGLRDSEFARLHLNQWAQSEDRLVSAADLEAAAVLDGEQEPRPGIEYLISCDLGLVNDRTVVAVGHAEETSHELGAPRRVVIDSIRRWRGTRLRPVQISEVEAHLTHTAKRYNHAKIICDPWQIVGLVQRLQAQGVQCEEFPFSTTSAGRLGQALHMALRNNLLWLPRDEELIGELGRVRLVESAIGQARLDHDSGSHDDQAVVIAMIVAELLSAAHVGGARRMLEDLHPLCPNPQCRVPNPRGLLQCRVCRTALEPVEPSAPYVPKSGANQLWSPLLRIVQEQQKADRFSGWFQRSRTNNSPDW
jgi:hypothetical protein